MVFMVLKITVPMIKRDNGVSISKLIVTSFFFSIQLFNKKNIKDTKMIDVFESFLRN